MVQCVDISIMPRLLVIKIFSIVLCVCRVTDPEMPFYGEPPTGVWRRYSEFELLRSYLEVMYPAIVVPPIPEKRVSMLLLCAILCLSVQLNLVILHCPSVPSGKR